MIIEWVDVAKISKQEQLVKAHIEDMEKMKGVVTELVSTVQLDLKRKIRIY